MKKLISILLVMMMILCMSTTAFADEPPTTKIIIGGDDADYEAYQLLTLTLIHTAGECEGPHTSACYTYSYAVNAKYKTVLQNEVFANGVGWFWNDSDNIKPTASTDVTDIQILHYLSELTGDNIDGTYGTLRPVADRIYLAIETAGLDADEDMHKGNNEASQGYWLIADATDLGAGANDAKSLVMVNTKGLDDLTITPKTGLPQFDKKVKDVNDSAADSDIDKEDWVDSADHDKGDTVPFKLTATVPAHVSGYETYTMVFHDEIDDTLEVDFDSFKVYKYDNKDAADTAKVPGGTLVNADKYELIENPEDDCSFELTLTDVLDITGVEAGTAFVVYYEATLKDTAVIGSTGNNNTAYLEFSNNPYNDAQTGKTPTDTVKVFTYQLTINKVDGYDNQPLNGAGFTLYKYNDDTEEYELLGLGAKNAEGTTFTWTHLDDGNYKLVETTVPDGYNKMEDLEFTISATHNPELTVLSGSLDDGTITLGDGLIEAPVTNYTGTILPSTGAKGTMMLIGGGSVFIVLAAVFMITRKKMSVYED